MDCSACLSCGMVVLLIMTGCRLFQSVKRFERSNGLDTALYKNYPYHMFMVLGKKDVFEYMCAGIGQDVVLSISNAWCDVGGGWNAG